MPEKGADPPALADQILQKAVAAAAGEFFLLAQCNQPQHLMVRRAAQDRQKILLPAAGTLDVILHRLPLVRAGWEYPR